MLWQGRGSNRDERIIQTSEAGGGGWGGDRSGLSSRITQESVRTGCHKEAYASVETAITRPWQTRNRSALSTFKFEHSRGVTKYPPHIIKDRHLDY